MSGKNLTVVSCCIVLGLVWCASSFAADKVGYLNLQRLVSESRMGKEASADLLKMRKEKEAMLTDKLREINKLKDLINKAGSRLTGREKRDKVNLLRKMNREYQRQAADNKEDIAREDRELVSIILEEANDIVKKVAKKGKYTIILKDPKAVGYLDPDVDITKLVLKELNKKK